MIDILRATTTIVVAMEAGAAAIYPCCDVEEARRNAKSLVRRPLLGGERHGVRIEGFDLGNSPLEYDSATVRGREIVFSTTNGTRALEACRQIPTVLISGFVNLSATVDFLIGADAEVIRLVCAGTDGQMTGEDVYYAGVLGSRLISASNNRFLLHDATRIAIEAAEHRLGKQPSKSGLVDAFRETQGGKNLVQLGMDRDLELAATLDTCRVVPIWNRGRGSIAIDLCDGALR